MPRKQPGAEVQEGSASRPRRWPQVLLALVALGITVALVLVGPAGWAALVLVWALLLLIRGRA